MADFALLESPKMIPRKIWLIVKSWNFHTLLYGYGFQNGQAQTSSDKLKQV